MRRSKKRQHESTTGPYQRSVDARQLSPGMDDYGMDDRHMDGLEGDDGDQPSPGEANFSVDVDATTLPTPNSDNQPSARRAECWRHFELFTEMVDGKSIPRAQCKYCEKILSAATSSGTGHLNRHYLAHLKNKAPAGARQTHLSFGPDGSVSTWTYDSKIAREEIAKFIVAEDLPIRMGESKHFERMIQKAFCPQYKKVSRKTTKNDITAIYRSKLSVLKQTLSTTSFSFAVTSDIWTSQHQRTSYLSVVLHYLDNNRSLNKRVIGFKLMTSHTGDAIATIILEVLREINLQSRVVSITLDNASANTTAMSILEPDLRSYVGGFVIHQRCICHVINLIVQPGMIVLDKLLNKIRRSVRIIGGNTVVKARFQDYCKAKNKPGRMFGIVKNKPGRMFGIDVKHRWNTTYLLLRQLKGYEELISIFINSMHVRMKDTDDDGDGEILILTDQDWEIATRVRKFLKPFYNATVQLSGIYYPTSCLVLEWIWKLALVLDENRSDRILSSIVKPMEEKFLKYFTAIPHLYCFALILDPRKKLEIAKVAMNSIGDAVGLDYSEAFQHVNNELYRVFRLYRTKLGGTPRVPEQTSQKKASKSSALNLWKQHTGKDQASPSSQNKSTWNPDSELNHYLVTDHTEHDPTLDGDDVDLLGWWKEKERTLPMLAHFARDILLVPASSVSSEQAFSATGRIIEERRSCLTPETVESIFCLKDWMKADERTQHRLDDQELADAVEDALAEICLTKDDGAVDPE
uniref:HAT family dimerisation domain containing protein n=1 Tax=Oryza sativa subsp. japonica TaxID=39947 RepID=Q7XED8_ORYSJ|nr:hAT family dimerisation domain containing protein [Oryza sativa Japonica Group]